MASSLFVSIPALTTPLIIIGGKIFGWFTATESACIAVLYAGALSLLVYREMNLKGLHFALLDTGKFAAIALFCVGTASAFVGSSPTTKSRKRYLPAFPPGTWS